MKKVRIPVVVLVAQTSEEDTIKTADNIFILRTPLN